ncbi:MAG: hypothetical protein AAB250_14100 [Bdellovibrionota bacterium]
MSTLWVSFLASLAFVGAAFRLHSILRARRLARLEGLELKPNCLLTRHPIAFLAAPRSLFRFFDPLSRDVPMYLREHGYEVAVVSAPLVFTTLDSMRERCHLIADSSHELTLKAVANKRHPMIASLTLIATPERRPTRQTDSNRKPNLDDFKPLPSAIETFSVAKDPERKPFWFEARLLELAISLAERDAMLSD